MRLVALFLLLSSVTSRLSSEELTTANTQPPQDVPQLPRLKTEALPRLTISAPVTNTTRSTRHPTNATATNTKTKQAKADQTKRARVSKSATGKPKAKNTTGNPDSRLLMGKARARAEFKALDSALAKVDAKPKRARGHGMPTWLVGLLCFLGAAGPIGLSAAVLYKRRQVAAKAGGFHV